MTRSRAAVASFFCLSLAMGCTSTSVPEARGVADVRTPDAEPSAASPAPAVQPPTAGEPASASRIPGVRLADHLSLGEPVRVGRLTVWPVLTDAPRDVGAFATLTDAQKRRRADVRECGSDAAGLSFDQRFRERQAIRADGAAEGGRQVHRLVVDNAGDEPLFVPAGTLVRGGDQDRVLAEDLVVLADHAALARVFCVELGRWTDLRGGVPTEGRFEAAECIAEAGVRRAGQYEGSQEGVWSRVAVVNSSMSAAQAAHVADASGGSSSLFVSVDDASDSTRSARAAVVDSVLRHFDSQIADASPTVGFAYAVDGRPVAVHTFAGPDLFRPRFGAYLQAMAMEATMAPPKPRSGARTARAEDVVEFVRLIGASGRTEVAERGTYRLLTRRSGAGWSCACVLTSKDGDATLSQDWTAR